MRAARQLLRCRCSWLRRRDAQRSTRFSLSSSLPPSLLSLSLSLSSVSLSLSLSLARSLSLSLSLLSLSQSLLGLSLGLSLARSVRLALSLALSPSSSSHSRADATTQPQTIVDLYTRDCLDMRPPPRRDSLPAAPVMPVSARLASQREEQTAALPPSLFRPPSLSPPDAATAGGVSRPLSFDERILNLRRQIFKEDFKDVSVPPACVPKAGAAGALSTHAIPPRSWGGHGSTSRA